jgi:DNA-binding CsgD family transcriptional regulator
VRLDAKTSRMNKPASVLSILEWGAGLSKTENIHDAWPSYVKLMETLGADFALFADWNQGDGNVEMVACQSTFPNDWVSHYVERKFEEVDFLLPYCQAHLCPLPVAPETDLKRDGLPPKAAEMINDGRELGMNTGVIVPVHANNGRFSVLNFSTSLNQMEFRRLYPEILAPLVLSAHLFNSSYSAMSHEGKGKVHTLSDREVECLRWLAIGRTPTQAADQIGIGERTFHFHIANAKRKLNARTRVQAIALAHANEALNL